MATGCVLMLCSLQALSVVSMLCGRVVGLGSPMYPLTGTRSTTWWACDQIVWLPQHGFTRLFARVGCDSINCMSHVLCMCSHERSSMDVCACAVICCAVLSCRAWLHTCLHLLVEIQRRYVAPDAFSPPPANLFWEPAQLPDGDTQLSALYR